MNEGSVETIWRENRRWVAAVLLAHKPRWEDLEDLLQDVAMTLVTKIHTVRSGESIRAWLRTVAINTARAAARSGKRRAESTVSGIEEDTLAARPPAELATSASETFRCIEQMPLTYREPLMLRAMHGMSSRVIGEIMDISEATVDTRVARARAMLRSMIQQPSDDPAKSAGAVSRNGQALSTPLAAEKSNGQHQGRAEQISIPTQSARTRS